MTARDHALIGGLRFSLLTGWDLRDLAERMACPQIAGRLTYYGQTTLSGHLACQAQRDRDGLDLMLVIDEDGLGFPVGLAGILGKDGEGRADDRPDFYSTATYLRAEWHGRGVNPVCKQVQWHLSRLTGRPLVATVAEDNDRSLSAMRSAWPDVQPQLEHTRLRSQYAFALHQPSAHGLLAAADADALTRLVAGTPALTRWA